MNHNFPIFVLFINFSQHKIDKVFSHIIEHTINDTPNFFHILLQETQDIINKNNLAPIVDIIYERDAVLVNEKSSMHLYYIKYGERYPETVRPFLDKRNERYFGYESLWFSLCINEKKLNLLKKQKIETLDQFKKDITEKILFPLEEKLERLFSLNSNDLKVYSPVYKAARKSYKKNDVHEEDYSFLNAFII